MATLPAEWPVFHRHISAPSIYTKSCSQSATFKGLTAPPSSRKFQLRLLASANGLQVRSGSVALLLRQMGLAFLSLRGQPFFLDLDFLDLSDLHRKL